MLAAFFIWLTVSMVVGALVNGVADGLAYQASGGSFKAGFISGAINGALNGAILYIATTAAWAAWVGYLLVGTVGFLSGAGTNYIGQILNNKYMGTDKDLSIGRAVLSGVIQAYANLALLNVLKGINLKSFVTRDEFGALAIGRMATLVVSTVNFGIDYFWFGFTTVGSRR